MAFEPKCHNLPLNGNVRSGCMSIMEKVVVKFHVKFTNLCIRAKLYLRSTILNRETKKTSHATNANGTLIKVPSQPLFPGCELFAEF